MKITPVCNSARKCRTGDKSFHNIGYVCLQIRYNTNFEKLLAIDAVQIKAPCHTELERHKWNDVLPFSRRIDFKNVPPILY